MKALTAILVALHVLAHSVLGCCWHHGHEHSPAVSDVASCSHGGHEHSAHAGHVHGVPAGDHQQPVPASPHEGCEGERCVATGGASKVCAEIVNLAGGPLHLPLADMYAVGMGSAAPHVTDELRLPETPLSGRTQVLRI